MALQTAHPLHRRSGPFLVLDFGQIQVQLQVEGVTRDNLQAYLDAETARMTERAADIPADFDKAIVIVDGSVALMPPADARGLQADWIKANQEMLRALTHKMAFVVPNPWVRAIVAAVFAIAPSPVPMKTFPTLEAAADWAIEESHALGGAVREDFLVQRAGAVQRLREVMEAA